MCWYWMIWQACMSVAVSGDAKLFATFVCIIMDAIPIPTEMTNDCQRSLEPLHCPYRPWTVTRWISLMNDHSPDPYALPYYACQHHAKCSVHTVHCQTIYMNFYPKITVWTHLSSWEEHWHTKHWEKQQICSLYHWHHTSELQSELLWVSTKGILSTRNHSGPVPEDA